MSQHQLVIGLLIGVQFIIISKITHSLQFYKPQKHINQTPIYQPNFESFNRLYGGGTTYNLKYDNIRKYSHMELDLDIPRTEDGKKNYTIVFWTNGELPYEINGDFDPDEKTLIIDTFKRFEQTGCLKFKERNGEADYLSIESNKTGCWSKLGRTSGRNTINLESPHCVHTDGLFIHEIMHRLGFEHENNRNNRDTYVEVIYENIIEEAKENFDKSPNIYPEELLYDFASILHFSPYMFSTNGSRTLRDKVRAIVI